MKTVEEINDHWDAKPTQRAPVGMSMAEYVRKVEGHSSRLPPVAKGTSKLCSSQCAEIIGAIRTYGPLTPQEIADATGIPYRTVQDKMQTLRSANKIAKIGNRRAGAPYQIVE